ncbi:MAG TPA: multidrug ABC transporter ATP-binding protein, partial [Alphaproteobacteria bacterium]|nr:multidrug ABC transporter ATP-binding protein [Alphaproteobacteria bacterium]
GSGKSTLLDLIAGRRQATGGSLRLGETVHLGYLDQHTDALTEGRGLERKVIEFVEEAASRIDLGGEQLSASQLLERFLFPPAQQHSPLSKLSGGERRRLSLCRMLIQAPNVLLLDEPTNDLDVQTLSVLEDLLEDFRGCVVVVSHDRYFLDRTVDRLFCFEAGRLQRFEGNYSAFLEHQRQKEKLAAEESTRHRSNLEKTRKPPALKTQGPRRRSFKESRELESLERELPQMEQRKADLEQAISTGKGDLTSLSHDLAGLLEALETSEERWLELSELAP